jgi:hypothetical protein
MRMHLLLGHFLAFLPLTVFCQTDTTREYHTVIAGREVLVQIEGNDTTLIAELDPAGILPLQLFEPDEEQQRYLKYRRYAFKVYPYAAHAVRLYNQVIYATKDMSPKERRAFVDRIDETLEQQFGHTLKNFSRTQGLLLTKMIERELNIPFLQIVKELRGGFAAFYWNQFGKINGYHLKEKYTKGEDPVLDAVLDEFDMKKDLPDHE